MHTPRLPQLAACCIALLSAHASAATDPALLGCWRFESMVQHYPDRDVKMPPQDCVIDIREATIISQCHRPAGELRIESSYTVPAPGKLDSTITASTVSATQVGLRRESTYRIAGSRLHIAATPAPNPNATAPQPTTIDSTLVRTQAPAGKAKDQPAACAPTGKVAKK